MVEKNVFSFIYVNSSNKMCLRAFIMKKKGFIIKIILLILGDKIMILIGNTAMVKIIIYKMMVLIFTQLEQFLTNVMKMYS